MTTKEHTAPLYEKGDATGRVCSWALQQCGLEHGCAVFDVVNIGDDRRALELRALRCAAAGVPLRLGEADWHEFRSDVSGRTLRARMRERRIAELASATAPDR